MSDGHVSEQEQQPPVNRWALAAWKWAWVPGAGLLKGRRALKEIRSTGERGREVAVRAVLVNAILSAAVVFGLVAMPYIWPNGPRGTDVMDLTTGQCLDKTGRHSMEPSFLTTERVTVVDCSHEHDGEVVGVWDAGGQWTDYPDEDALRGRAAKECRRRAFGYTMDPWHIPDTGEMHLYAPTEAGWVRGGDHSIVCMMEMNSGRTTGSVHGEPSSFTAQQRAYLAAENGYTLADSWRPDDESATADVPSWTGYASDMARAARAGEQALDARTWSASATGPVAAVKSDLHRLAGLWTRAAAATEGVTIDDCVTRADAVHVESAEVEVRRAMGLTVEQADSLHLTDAV